MCVCVWRPARYTQNTLCCLRSGCTKQSLLSWHVIGREVNGVELWAFSFSFSLSFLSSPFFLLPLDGLRCGLPFDPGRFRLLNELRWDISPTHAHTHADLQLLITTLSHTENAGELSGGNASVVLLWARARTRANFPVWSQTWFFFD